jgi:D-alanyl-D-alanine dipeptidase
MRLHQELAGRKIPPGLSHHYLKVPCASEPLVRTALALSLAVLFLSAGAFGQDSSSPLLPGPQPADAPEQWKNFIGEYGPDNDLYFVLERSGKLYLVGKNGGEGTLTANGPNNFALSSGVFPLNAPINLHRDAQGNVSLQLGTKSLARRNFGPEKGQVFRIKPVRSVEELRQAALADSPPKEKGTFRQPDLVELATLDPTIHLDIRYATTNDFLGTPVYTEARAFLQRPAAEALLRAQQKLRPLGYGLLIHDAYRPWYVTKIFWDATPPEGKIFVADPSQGSRHNRGCAVDLTLYDRQTGKPIEMPGTYDEMSPRSYPNYPGGTSLQRWHRDLLRRAMEAEGFTVYEAEWWHFDYKDWREYPILNIPFEKLDIVQKAAQIH